MVESWGATETPGDRCVARIGLQAAPDRRDAGFVYFPCDKGPSFGHDPVAQLLIPERDIASVAFDYGLRRVVRGGVREVRRPLAPVSEWTIGGALGLLLALWILRDAMRTPKALDRTEWRQGARYLGEHEIVFDDGSPPLSASIMPAWCRGPVAVRVEGGWLGPGYRDDRSGAAFTALAGSFDEVDRALRDVRDAALTRALAIAWTAGAPLAACGWTGLLW